tara:strand:+ start:528 stop:1754 length:1227 start_codon:yes stop_codon:yes gene_type:complete
MSAVDKFFILNNSNPSYIITNVDCDIAITENLLQKYIYEICEKNPNLLEKLSFENNEIISKKQGVFNIGDHYELRNMESDVFSSSIDELFDLSSGVKNQMDWFFLCCVDKTKNVSRIYFKINHSCCDGYTLIKILRSSTVLDKNQEENEIIEPSCKKAGICLYDKIYYHTIGLLVLFFVNLKIVFLILFNYCKYTFWGDNDRGREKSLRYFECRPLPLDMIKYISKLKGVTVNDFLFSIMVRADYLYYNKRRGLVTMMPFSLKNIGAGEDGLNNFVPITNIIDNNYANIELLHKSHSVFSAYKYSSYIYVFNCFITFISKFFSCDIFSLYMKGPPFVDYIFTNIIGPPIENSHIKDYKFLISPLNGEFTFNIISSRENINIVCSLTDESIDTVRFEQCVYDAYQELIQ